MYDLDYLDLINERIAIICLNDLHEKQMDDKYERQRECSICMS